MKGERSEVRRQTSEFDAPSARHFTALTIQRFNGPPSVDLHIEELVLDGFAPSDRYAIGDSLARELAWLLGEEGIPISLRSENATDEISGASFHLLPNATPPAIGQQIAHAVHERFSQ